MAEEKPLLNLSVTPKVKEILNTIVTWAKIIAVVNFVSVPLEFFQSVMEGEVLTAILMAVATIIINVYLINFSIKVKRALDTTDQEDFNAGMQDLHVYFKVVGIFLILLIAGAVLMIVWALSRGATAFGSVIGS